MKFGEAFKEYMRGEPEWFLDKWSHVEYKRLKKVLKRCKRCKELDKNCNEIQQKEEEDSASSEPCRLEHCPWCDQMFFSELMKEASDIACCFSSRVRRLLNLHVAKGMQKYMLCFRECYKSDHQEMLQEGRILLEYITMNAIAIRKILKKYDKVHSSVNGRNFKLKMRAEHKELLQLPWLIELGAFCLNYGLDKGTSAYFSCDLGAQRPTMQMMLPNVTKLEFDLTCAICLEVAFNPYALRCGHLFCKSCACSSASVMIFQGVKAADADSKCPVCREAGVYANALHMLELDLLLKKRCKEYWKERLIAERAETVKQAKIYWDQQTKYMIGY